MSTSARQRPKPWESSGPLDEHVPSTDGGSMTRVASGANESVDNSSDAPPRPAGLNHETMNDPMSSYRNTQYGGGGYGGSMYGNSMLGGGLYGGNSMLGGGYGSMYGSGYGSMYGNNAYGSLYGNGYGGGGYMGGMNGQPGALGESTQATFQLIESLIGAVAGFAQMLESTYMATHNSFFSMISVAEQFSYMKEMLGSFFGIFAMIKFLRRSLYYITRGRIGSPPKASGDKSDNGKDNGMVKEFEKFTNGRDEPKRGKKISWKPLIFFLAAVFGFPYLLNKFIARMQSMQSNRIGAHPNQRVDPSKLEFARALYDFTPENPQIEVTLKKGDLMAIMNKQDPTGRDSEWWKVRTKSGEIGFVPYNYVEVIKRQNKIERIQEQSNENPQQ